MSCNMLTIAVSRPTFLRIIRNTIYSPFLIFTQSITCLFLLINYIKSLLNIPRYFYSKQSLRLKRRLIPKLGIYNISSNIKETLATLISTRSLNSVYRRPPPTLIVRLLIRIIRPLNKSGLLVICVVEPESKHQLLLGILQF